MKDIIVQKFGGTSVADTDKIKNVAKAIIREKSNGNDVVVVVSAMGHTTDILTKMAKEITDANLQEVLDNEQLVVIDFWAEWCGPCRMISPIIDELAKEYDNKVCIGKVNVDENDDVVEKYGIRNIPTILFIKNGEIVDKKVGASSKADLKAKIDALL